jgi:serine/threonine protein kinase
MFIHKYYKPVLKEEAKNLDLENSILMEFCPQRSLNNYLSACEGIISLPIKLYWLYQVSIALRFLRDLGIVHLDLKPDNILIKIYGKSLPYYLLRLIDFGESYWRATTVHVGAKRGITIPYSAP